MSIYNSVNSKSIRLTNLEILKSYKASQLGSNMSVVEILISIYSSMEIDLLKNKHLYRDRELYDEAAKYLEKNKTNHNKQYF